jgi:ABC-type Mn2+/Zn2+ transport system permease subunit
MGAIGVGSIGVIAAYFVSITIFFVFLEPNRDAFIAFFGSPVAAKWGAAIITHVITILVFIIEILLFKNTKYSFRVENKKEFVKVWIQITIIYFGTFGLNMTLNSLFQI